MSGQRSVQEIPVNQWPINKLALRWLRKGKQKESPHLPYILQLIIRGLFNGVPLLGPGESFREDLEAEISQLLRPRFDPVKVMRWLLNNPNGPDDPEEQAATLEQGLETAETWQEAAQAAIEVFHSRLAAENDYYQPAPTR